MIGKTVNCEGKNLQDVLKLDRSWLPLLQEVDPGIAQLNVIQWFINAGKRPDASTKTPEYIRYYSMANLLADYRDYLRMCKEMQYNVESSFIAAIR